MAWNIGEDLARNRTAGEINKYTVRAAWQHTVRWWEADSRYTRTRTGTHTIVLARQEQSNQERGIQATPYTTRHGTTRHATYRNGTQREAGLHLSLSQCIPCRVGTKNETKFSTHQSQFLLLPTWVCLDDNMVDSHSLHSRSQAAVHWRMAWHRAWDGMYQLRVQYYSCCV